MAQQIAPPTQYQFGGIVTAGHPLQRPQASSVVCENFRVMPGGWLRLRGGRVKRLLSSGAAYQFFEFRRSVSSGGIFHLIQRANGGGEEWAALNINSPTYTITSLETITGGSAVMSAVCGLRDRALYSNGLGTRTGSVSEPALSSWDTAAANVRYSGLDAYVPSGTNPTVTFADNVSGTCDTAGSTVSSLGGTGFSGLVGGGLLQINGIFWLIHSVDSSAQITLDSSLGITPGTLSGANYSVSGGLCQVLYSRTFYVGIYNTATGHFSNGVLAGTVFSPDQGNVSRAGTITIHNPQALAMAYHDSQEQAELKYVLYCTLDGGAVPYLLMDTTGVSPVTINASTTSFTLNANSSSVLAGYSTDVTQEMPTDNWPPRPMRQIAYTNGRVYGLLDSTGNGGGSDFSYVVTPADLPSVVWTAAADDFVTRSFVGVPEESWPLDNIKYTPNGEIPLAIAPSMNRSQLLVITRSGTFFLEETADGLQEWVTISQTEGISSRATLAHSPYGPIWVTQRGELVNLPQGALSLQTLSGQAPALFNQSWSSFACCDYLQDPINSIDRYQVWLVDGTSIICDFALGGRTMVNPTSSIAIMSGQFYTTLNPSGTPYSAAKSMINTAGQRCHVVCDGTNLYNHEQDPFIGYIPTTDQTGASTFVEIPANYIGQWTDGGDSSVRKEFSQLDVIGDGALSTQLAALPLGGNLITNDPTTGDYVITQGSPVTLSWFADLTSAELVIPIKKTNQAATDAAYRGKVSNGNAFWFKVRVQLHGHSADGGAFYQYPIGGDLAPSVYGAIFAIRYTVDDKSGNRS